MSRQNVLVCYKAERCNAGRLTLPQHINQRTLYTKVWGVFLCNFPILQNQNKCSTIILPPHRTETVTIC
nr:MAG TPA: hypothetical protein [Bacteriophage sp.]